MQIDKVLFGQFGNKEVQLFALSNERGMSVKISNYGGIVTSIVVPDKNGHFDDVVLGYDTLDRYLKDTYYFGAIVGRYANRIAKGKFTLDEEEYNLAINNGPNHLHGGIKAFDKVIWDAETFQDDEEVGLKLHYLSKDGEEGYPGNLDATVQYILNNKNELKIVYNATTDKATPVNLTHHSYFNLSGSMEQDVLEHKLWINADSYIDVDETLIPSGDFKDVKGPMDFRTPKAIGSHIVEVQGGYDHNYVLNNNGNLALVATLTEGTSRRTMEVFTTKPGVQFYLANFLDRSIKGKNGIVYNKHAGLCLETQHFPDAPNQPSFPNTIVRPGKSYKHQSVYKFGLMK